MSSVKASHTFSSLNVSVKKELKALKLCYWVILTIKALT